jgi:hypothetical protein
VRYIKGGGARPWVSDERWPFAESADCKLVRLSGPVKPNGLSGCIQVDVVISDAFIRLTAGI